MGMHKSAAKAVITFTLDLDEAVKVKRILQSRIFKGLCEHLGSLHAALLLHPETMWLSLSVISCCVNLNFERKCWRCWVVEIDKYKKINFNFLTDETTFLTITAKGYLITSRIQYWASAVELIVLHLIWIWKSGQFIAMADWLLFKLKESGKLLDVQSDQNKR